MTATVTSHDLEVGSTYRVTTDGLAEFVGIYLGLSEVGLLRFKYRLDADAKGRNTITSVAPREISSVDETQGELRAPGLVTPA